MSAVRFVVEPRRREIGEISVERILPHAEMRAVGPFVFLDRIGPLALPPEEGIDVPPHPHIGLATVTYLLEGAFLHRDSLGTEQVIRPGEINWMTAGRGIVHSERTPSSLRDSGARLHGVQAWVALPKALEQTEPRFQHVPQSALPVIEFAEPTGEGLGGRAMVLAGSFMGATAPTQVDSPLFYADVRAISGASWAWSVSGPKGEAWEGAILVLEGELEVVAGGDIQSLGLGKLTVLASGASLTLRAKTAVHAIFLGGAPLDGPRHMRWNYVSTELRLIEEADRAWKLKQFPQIPGDPYGLDG